MTPIQTALVLALALATLADIHSTAKGLRRGFREANPVVAWFLDTFGDLWWLAKAALAALGGWLCLQGGTVGLVILAAVTLLTAAVAVRNYRLLR